MANNMQADGHLASQLSKDLSDDILIAEIKCLMQVHFPFQPKTPQIVEQENKFDAQSWYTDSPVEQDTLY